MSGDVAVFGQEALSTVSQLKALRAAARCASAEAAPILAQQAKRARDWLKLLDAAQELREEATALELEALRRCGQMGVASRHLTRARADVATRLGNMSDGVFADVLTYARASSSPAQVLRDYDQVQNSRRKQAEIKAVLYAEQDAHADLREVDTDVAGRAASELLDQLTGEGEPFTVADAADRLRLELQATYGERDFWTDREVRRGLEQLVAESVRRADFADQATTEITLASGRTVTAPAFITYQDVAVDKVWLRIPWESAHLGHLAAMARFRAEQARHMAARAEDLAELVALLETSAAKTGETLCYRLFAATSADEEGVAS